MEPLLIYADQYGREIDTIAKFSGDFSIGDVQNNFSLDVPNDLGIEEGYYLIIDDSEFGGIVDDIEIDTAKEYMTAAGRTWQGVWEKTVVEPDSGQSHLVLSGDLNEVIAFLIERQGLSDRMVGAENQSGITVSNYRVRYEPGYSALRGLCASVGAKPVFRYNGHTRKCVVSAVARGNYVDEGIDGEVNDFKLKRSLPTNHWIGLGKGEGTARIVVHRYTNLMGDPVAKQTVFGMLQQTEIYESPSAESDDLIEAIEKRIKENQKKRESCSLEDADFSNYDIGDIVGGRSSKHRNIYVVTEIAQKTAEVTPKSVKVQTKTAQEVSR